ncbi:MAG: flagellar biosynthetic protein FliR [Planctomycetota bacterium]
MGAQLIALTQQVAPGLLVFARVAGVFLAAPVVGGTWAPARIKALLAFAITLVIAPGLDLAPGIAGGATYMLALGSELLIGLMLGFFFNLFIEAVRFGGDLIGRQAGFAAAELFDPNAGGMTGPLGSLLHLATVLLFLAIDGHHQVFLALQHSYALVAGGAMPRTEPIGPAVALGANQVFVIAVSLAFPLMIAVMAITVADGIIARAIPQINLLMITFINKILVTVFLLYVGMPAVVTFLGLVLRMARGFTFEFLRALS